MHATTEKTDGISVSLCVSVSLTLRRTWPRLAGLGGQSEGVGGDSRRPRASCMVALGGRRRCHAKRAQRVPRGSMAQRSSVLQLPRRDTIHRQLLCAYVRISACTGLRLMLARSNRSVRVSLILSHTFSLTRSLLVSMSVWPHQGVECGVFEGC
jgi:hypothetical protein